MIGIGFIIVAESSILEVDGLMVCMAEAESVNHLSVVVKTAESGEPLIHARALILEYASSLGFDLGFQGFDEEFQRLPGEYAAPSGALLVAYAGDAPAGCVGVRKLSDDTCEMKRMYVRPEYRGRGIGRIVAAEALTVARALGYRLMRLDTIASMGAARALYLSLGFYPIEPYRHNPLPGAVYMECQL